MPDERVWTLLWAAVLLGPERVFYVWLTRAPEQFQRLCARVPGLGAVEAVKAVRWCFIVFKTVQIAVFAWWCGFLTDGQVAVPDPAAAAIGLTLIAAGQTLNLSAFYRLGAVGILYGGQLGRQVPRTDEFPYSVFQHPQYVGVVLSIWGLFLMLRFPHVDWWVLPLLETAYYSLSGHFERGPA